MTEHLPDDFDWKSYLEFNADLRNAGLDTEKLATQHFLLHGRFEHRIYHSAEIRPDPKYQNGSVFIAGTGRSIEVFEDKGLVEILEKRLPVLCINTSFHYFNHISCLFLNGRFRNMDYNVLAGKVIDEIYAPFRWGSKDRTARQYRVNVNTELYSPEISFDLNQTLPHGPTTLLDVVFPYCVFHKIRRIYILGAEYDFEDAGNHRHAKDSLYINRSTPAMDRKTEHQFALRKLDTWNEFFMKNQIDCYALSEESNTPFQKSSLWEVLNT